MTDIIKKKKVKKVAKKKVAKKVVKKKVTKKVTKKVIKKVVKKVVRKRVKKKKKEIVKKRKVTKEEKRNCKCFTCQEKCKQDPKAKVIYCPFYYPLDEV